MAAPETRIAMAVLVITLILVLVLFLDDIVEFPLLQHPDLPKDGLERALQFVLGLLVEIDDFVPFPIQGRGKIFFASPLRSFGRQEGRGFRIVLSSGTVRRLERLGREHLLETIVAAK